MEAEMRVRQQIAVICGLFAVVATLTGCGSTSPNPSTSAGSSAPASLTFIFPNSQPTLSFYPYYVARDLGYYTAEKLSVTFVGSDGGAQAEQQIIAGKADVGSPPVTSSLTAAGQAFPVKFIYSFSTGSNFGVFVNADSPINQIADLKGKTIGITNASGGEVPILNAALGSAKVDPTTVKEVAIGDGGPVTYGALKNGSVAAYATSYTSEATLIAAGLKLRDITPSQFQSFPAFGMTTTATVLKSKKDALARFGKAIAEATYFCQSSPSACQTIMQKDGPQQWTDPKLGGALLTRILNASKVAVGSQYGLIDASAFATYQGFAKASDPTYKNVDLNTFLDKSLVTQFNNFDHAAIKSAALAYK
jgi:NitT/TauT family transport system substrate-binding protein